RDAAAAAAPERDIGHLAHFFDDEERLPDLMRRRQLDDRILLGRQHAADLLVPLLTSPRAPVVGREDEAALLEILAQLDHLIVGEARGAAVFDEDVRTLEERRVGGGD